MIDASRFPQLAAIGDEQDPPGYQGKLEAMLASDNPADWAAGLALILEREVHDSAVQQLGKGLLEELTNRIT